MHDGPIEFIATDTCDCCRKHIGRTERFISICKFPDGGTDTICLRCYRTVTQSSIAWFAYEGNLPTEPPEKRLERAVDVAKQQMAITVLEGIIYKN